MKIVVVNSPRFLRGILRTLFGIRHDGSRDDYR